MTLDAQHDRTDPSLAPVSAPTRSLQQTTDPAAQECGAAAADRPEAEPVPTPTNAFEAFGSFPG
jgi:hypothetical protein